jgi:uncharacterized protein
MFIFMIGAASGLFSGLFGVGGAIILIPLLVGKLNLDQKVAQGTTLAFIIPVALVSGIIYTIQAHIQLNQITWLASGSLLGIYFGSHTAAKVPSLWLKKGFGVFMILVALRMFWL